MHSRLCLLLAIVAATSADRLRQVRQTSPAPEIRWTMYSTPKGDAASNDNPEKVDLGSWRNPLTVLPLNETDPDDYVSFNNLYINPDWEYSCPRRFGYYRFEQSCDIYIECRNYRPIRKLCPDGMHFKETARWSEYPCGYPSEAPCLGRGGVQPPRPSEQCPHQFGFYPITDKSWPIYERCSRYIACSAGVARMMNCSIGLVFNPKIERCDWPERVPECRDFLGFRCPVPSFGDEDLVLNYRYATDPECRYFFSCHNGRSRVLSCDDGLAFDAIRGKCIDEELVVCNPDAYVTPAPTDGGYTFGYHSVPLS